MLISVLAKRSAKNYHIVEGQWGQQSIQCALWTLYVSSLSKKTYFEGEEEEKKKHVSGSVLAVRVFLRSLAS